MSGLGIRETTALAFLHSERRLKEAIDKELDLRHRRRRGGGEKPNDGDDQRAAPDESTTTPNDDLAAAFFAKQAAALEPDYDEWAKVIVDKMEREDRGESLVYEDPLKRFEGNPPPTAAAVDPATRMHHVQRLMKVFHETVAAGVEDT